MLKNAKVQEKMPFLRVKGLTKTFGNVVALKGVDFDIDYGEIIGLLGDNGAGKSTLVKLLMGVFPPDKGEIYFRGKKTIFHCPEEARASGVEVVYQDSNLIKTMVAWRNFFIGKEETRKFGFFKFLDISSMRKETLGNLEKVKITMESADGNVSVLSGGEKQALAISRALYFGAEFLILDEPTTALSVKETEKVLSLIKTVKTMGCSVVLITHNIYHAFSVADKFVILDHGVKICSLLKENSTPERITEIIRRGRLDE